MDHFIIRFLAQDRFDTRRMLPNNRLQLLRTIVDQTLSKADTGGAATIRSSRP